MKLSIVVPMLNEEAAIAGTLRALRTGSPEGEIIAVDGGSGDRSIEIARPLCDLLIEAPRGRAAQMNAGAVQATGEILAFVHADTIVPRTFAADIEAATADPHIVGGRFDLRLDDGHALCVLIGAFISLRSRVSRTATGDQAIFVRRHVFQTLGGFPDLPICEDLEFARRLKRTGKVACLRSTVVTSARRWRKAGIIRTVVRMWLIRGAYLAGVPPAKLARGYGDIR